MTEDRRLLRDILEKSGATPKEIEGLVLGEFEPHASYNPNLDLLTFYGVDASVTDEPIQGTGFELLRDNKTDNIVGFQVWAASRYLKPEDIMALMPPAGDGEGVLIPSDWILPEGEFTAVLWHHPEMNALQYLTEDVSYRAERVPGTDMVLLFDPYDDKKIVGVRIENVSRLQSGFEIHSKP